MIGNVHPNPSQRASPEDVRFLSISGLVDAPCYRSRAGLTAESDPVRHYLEEGWSRGLEPCDDFEGEFLRPYYEAAGLPGPPALIWLELCARPGHRPPRSRLEAAPLAEEIRGSRFFDAHQYAGRLGSGLDPAVHYAVVGELLGWPASSEFSATYYLNSYKDLLNSNQSPLLHYTRYGYNEGRRSVPGGKFTLPDLPDKRPAILLILHETSRTGAPILGFNIAKRLARNHNVVALLLRGGELVEDFKGCCSAVIGPLEGDPNSPVDIDDLVGRLSEAVPISYAIANSIESRVLLRPLTLARIPVLALVHEFSSHVSPRGTMGKALEWATEIVFSAELTAAAARADYPSLQNRPIRILRQGRPDLPERAASLTEEQIKAIRRAMRPAGSESDFVVLGVGTVNLRKGVDIFISCASAVMALRPSRTVRFVWIGGPPPGSDMDRIYQTFLDEQIARSHLGDSIAFVGDVADLDIAYSLADMFFVSSRLDPLPNVAIEAALRGLPVICFKDATGIAEILDEDPITRQAVLPHLDAQAAAERVAALADDPVAYREMGGAVSRLAQRAFDMDGYVAQLEKLGQEAMTLMQQREHDFVTIRDDTLFDLDHFNGYGTEISTRAAGIRLFLARSAAMGVGRQPSTNFYYRRPCPGFHPQIYEHLNGAHYDRASINALAHFIRSGKPTGPWSHRVITPGVAPQHVDVDGLRIALQGHFYYPELIAEFCDKFACNKSQCDLFLTTSSEEKAEPLRAATEDYRHGKVTIRIVPNRGRDIGAFLTDFTEEIVENYDVVGHLHGKRSLFLEDSLVGTTWREFAWQNLLGDSYPMADVIISCFAADEKLGLVFPDDPHLSDWDLNHEIATELGRRMGIVDPLPPFFNFPVGTMFWARTDALKPLLELKLTWNDYPVEPAPIDGTILHAIERLLPIIAQFSGYSYATTHIPGVSW